MKNSIQLILNDVAQSYQVLQVFRLGSVILLSIVLVNFGIQSDDIGDFEWFIFLANAASFFWGMGLKNAFMSFYPKLEEAKQSKLIFSITILFLVLGCLAFLVLTVFEFDRLDELYTYLPWLFCFLVFGTIASLSEHILIVKDKARTLFYYGLGSYAIYLFFWTLIFDHTISIHSSFIRRPRGMGNPTIFIFSNLAE